MADYLYLCDGNGCKRNCAENGYKECTHTQKEEHARNKIRRQRKFQPLGNDTMIEVENGN